MLVGIQRANLFAASLCTALCLRSQLGAPSASLPSLPLSVTRSLTLPSLSYLLPLYLCAVFPGGCPTAPVAIWDILPSLFC